MDWKQICGLGACAIALFGFYDVLRIMRRGSLNGYDIFYHVIVASACGFIIYVTIRF